MIKRIIVIVLMLLISFTLVSCNKKPTDPDGNKTDNTTEKDDNGVILDEEIWE